MKHTDHTLCWHCRHAVPTKDKITGEYLTGCAWSIDRKPVEGWRTCQHRQNVRGAKGRHDTLVYSNGMSEI